MMFSSNNDALSHIDSHILSWKSLNIKKEELLSKINTILTEYTRRCYDVDHFCQYEFISIEKLLGYGTVYQSRIPSSALSELALCHQDQKEAHGPHHQLLIGFITNQPKETSSQLGQIFIEDGSGAVDLLCIDARPCLLGNLVVIAEWTFIPCLNSNAKPYVEVKSSVLELFNYPNAQHSLDFLSAENPRRQRSKQVVSLSESICYLSPIHRISGSDPFFMVKLESTPQPVVVLGNDKMCWWHFLKPGLIADFIDVKHSKLNKGSIEERDIIRTTSKSRIAIFNEKQKEIVTMKTNEKNCDLISYSGTITDCTMADRGMFELDNRFRLIVTHQPCESYCVGLRIGARICAYNIHLVVSAKIPYLVCCTCSTVKVVEHSSLFADHKPFVQLHNCFAKDCQEMRIKDYIHWIRLSDDLRKRFIFLSEKKAASLGRLLLNDYISYNPRKRNVFQEFCSEPHRCIASSENHATPPKVWSLADIISRVRTLFIQSSETIPWSKGDQYDRLSSHALETGNSWSYKLLSPENVGNVVILGELDVSHVDGQLILKDESGVISIEVIPNIMQNIEHRDGMCRSLISRIISDEKSIFVLSRYLMVLEKIKSPRIASHNCEIYLLTDPEADGNLIFSPPQRGYAYKRKQIATKMNRLVSKRRRGDDGGVLALENGELRDSPSESDALGHVLSSAASRIAHESPLQTQEGPATVACRSTEGRAKRNDLISVEAEIKLCNAKVSEIGGRSTDLVEAMGRTPFGEKSHAGKDSITCEFRQDIRKEKGGVKGKADSNRAIFAYEKVNLECDCAEKPSENTLPLNNVKYCQKNRTKELTQIEKEHDSFNAFFHVIFIRKVTVLQTTKRGGSVHCSSTVNGFLIGRLRVPEDSRIAEDRSATASIGRSKVMIRSCLWPKFMIDGDCQLEAMNHKETQLQLVLDTRFKSDYTLIKSGNFYLIESTRNIANTYGNIVKADLNLGSDSMFHLAELVQEKLKVHGCSTILLPKDCVKSIKTALKLYYEGCRTNTSVRSTLKIGSTYRDRNWSFSGLVISRSVKMSSPWRVKDGTSVVLLRVKDFVSLDEIVVYIYPNKFSIPNGCLPGALVHFKDIELKTSRARKLYCTVTAATEIRVMCFNKSELDRLPEYCPISFVPGMSCPMYRKTLMWFLGNTKEALNLIWQVKLDFLAVRWALVYWKCKVCNQKVHQLLCTRGCPQEWKFITQLSVVVDDGTAQAHLQIEQSLFHRFLALPAAHWLLVLEAAKCEELTYPREIDSDIQQNFPLPVQSGSNASQRRQAENMLWKLFREINERPTYIVHCRLFNHGEKTTAQDRIRTIKIGNEEFLTIAPRRINLQAIEIQRIDYSTEIGIQISSEVRMN